MPPRLSQRPHLTCETAEAREDQEITQNETVNSTWAKIQCGALSAPYCFHVECLALFLIKYVYYTNDIVATLARILNKREEIF